MNPNALALVVPGALLHAVWNFFAKKASGGLPFVWLFGIISLIVAVLFGVFSWSADPQPFSFQAWSAIAAYTVIDGWAIKSLGLVPVCIHTGSVCLDNGAAQLRGPSTGTVHAHRHAIRGRLLREAFIPSRIIGTVCMVAGVIMLAMA